jgi:N-acetylmuramoyl-L-alanine amidase
VLDVRRRLAALGFDTSADGPGRYGPATEAAVRQFQEQRGLRIDGVCGEQTWSSLVEAGYRLGDRMLYLHAPMLRGDDVLTLQRTLGSLGFDAGRVDGILGPNTAAALQHFQRNAGLTTDGICGPATIEALERFTTNMGDSLTVGSVREADRLREPRDVRDRRVAVGEMGGLAALADAVGRALLDAGAVVAVLHQPDESTQASEANAFGAEAFIGLALRDQPGCQAAYYATEGFESVGGRHLAELALEEVPAELREEGAQAAGMRLAILRETRMPAVFCEIGPPALVVQRTAELAEGLARAIARWVTEPLVS